MLQPIENSMNFSCFIFKFRLKTLFVMFKQHYAVCMFPKGFIFIFRSSNPKIGTTC